MLRFTLLVVAVFLTGCGKKSRNEDDPPFNQFAPKAAEDSLQTRYVQLMKAAQKEQKLREGLSIENSEGVKASNESLQRERKLDAEMNGIEEQLKKKMGEEAFWKWQMKWETDIKGK